jgi:hypothetical protein
MLGNEIKADRVVKVMASYVKVRLLLAQVGPEAVEAESVGGNHFGNFVCLGFYAATMRSNENERGIRNVADQPIIVLALVMSGGQISKAGILGVWHIHTTNEEFPPPLKEGANRRLGVNFIYL